MLEKRLYAEQVPPSEGEPGQGRVQRGFERPGWDILGRDSDVV